jgi:hypothetical protein
MAVQCAHCGEELLGSVNRCFRCGQTLVAHAGPTDLPPVRRPPIADPVDAPVAAILVSDQVDDESRNVPPMRTGSPFTSPSTTLPHTLQARFQNLASVPGPRASSLAPNLAGGFSIGLGVIACVISYAFWPGGVGIALAGIGFGLWSLASHKRLLGTSGLVLSVIGFAVAVYFFSTSL